MSSEDLALRPQGISAANVLSEPGWYVWGASVIEGDDRRFHMMYERWPHGTHLDPDDPYSSVFDGFRGWIKYSEIAYAIADNLTGPYRHESTVLRGTGDPNRWDRFTYHNPLIRWFNGRWYLYFISNSVDRNLHFDGWSPRDAYWLQHNCTQQIGVVSADTLVDLLTGQYTPAESPIMSPDGVWTFEVATNPAVTQGPDGRFWLMYKSRRPHVGHMTMWIAVSEYPDRGFRTLGPVFDSPGMAAEDPTMWYDQERGRFYAVMKDFAGTGGLTSQLGALALVTSVDGQTWQPAEDPVVSYRSVSVDGAPQPTPLTHLERPFVFLGDDGRPAALFAAAAIGDPFTPPGPTTGPLLTTVNLQLGLTLEGAPSTPVGQP